MFHKFVSTKVHSAALVRLSVGQVKEKAGPFSVGVIVFFQKSGRHCNFFYENILTTKFASDINGVATKPVVQIQSCLICI